MIEQLRAGLDDRYDIVREIGRGGMATVYLANDVRHGRRVAIKVLRPELAHSIGTDRFLREIRVAANLTHPNILPLHDSGQVDSLLYYVMPYIEGESLEDRLSREKRLPVADAVRITRQLARALHHAHSQGVVHRDIKPANVLIAGDQAVLSDFGIARAVDSSHSEKLTGTGLAIGTPAYMSPEQVTGEHEVDGRSDIYGLGCMLYEMLTGAPPFSAATPRGLMARQAVDRAPKLRRNRQVPRSLELAVQKAMAKDPSDRFQDGAELAAALDAHPTIPGTLTSLARWRPRRLARTAGSIAIVVAAAFAGSRILGHRGSDASDLDETAVAIMPFRVGGAIEAGSGNLATDLPQLLYERLPGDVGPRALVTTSVTTALRESGREGAEAPSPEDAAAVSVDLGAGRFLLGQAIGQGRRLTLTATLYRTATGEEVARADEVEGPADSLLSLVDQLAAKLLSREAGVTEHRLPTLLSTRLPALRAYLAGQADQAADRYPEAATHFNEALDQDTTFALAGLSLLQIRDYAPGGTWARALATAWNHRDRLSDRDRQVLTAVLGPRHPAASTASERLAAWDAVVETSPERADAWYELGDLRLQVGPFVGLPDARTQARAALQRAIALEPRHTRALRDLLDLAIVAGDTAAARDYADRFFALQSDPGSTAPYRWRLAVARGDTAALRQIREGFDELTPEALQTIAFRAQVDGVGLGDAGRVAGMLRQSAASNDDREAADDTWRWLLLNEGRPGRAAAVPWPLRTPSTRAWSRLHRVVFALYWGADSAGIAPPDARLVDDGTPVDPDPEAIEHFEACSSGLLWMASGDYRGAAEAIAHLQAVSGSIDDPWTAFIDVCAAMLDAQRAQELRAPDALEKLDRLDELLRSGPEVFGMMSAAGNLVAARLFEARGDADRALAAIRRRRYGSRGLPLLSTMLREEGRLAEAAGDTGGAIAAYRHYLSLRDDPEPAMADEVAGIRDALSALVESGTSVVAPPNGGP